MRGFLHAGWLAPSATVLDASSSSPIDSVRRLVESLGDAEAGASGAAYAVADTDDVIRRLVPNRKRLGGPQFAAVPAWVVLTELSSLRDALWFDEEWQAQVRAAGASRLVALPRAVYREIETVTGPSADGSTALTHAVHLGRFSMPSPEEEWEISKWYQETRLASFRVMPGATRCRRYVAACGGHGRFAVLYEFRSDADRLAYFESLAAARSGERNTDSPVQRTVHEPFSSCGGTVVARFG